ncbi:hypothetical protein HMPREF3209_02473 [Lactobacillus crispatus]|nr:hypothetical protein HMPREF0506_1085 [Lactobacillus crispatus JV-V01]KXI11098.1 hypothetical protein HMPREF3209_02473 [Lactobacillus crispatus]
MIALAQNNHVGNGTAVGSKWTFMILLILIIIKLFLALVFVPKKR